MSINTEVYWYFRKSYHSLTNHIPKHYDLVSNVDTACSTSNHFIKVVRLLTPCIFLVASVLVTAL